MNLVGTLTTSRKKWLIASSVMFGTILVVMDMNMVSVALPQMMGTFGKTQSAITWVATSYIIAELVLVTMAGWLSTVLGRKRLYLLSFLLFILASALAGTAHTFAQMLAYRTLQGIGGGSLVPVTGAILRETFPRREWAMAMAIYGMAVVIASGVAPLLGGWLTEEYGWSWVFYINVPIGLIGMLLVHFHVEDPPYLRRGVQRIDWMGIILLSVGLTAMQIVLVGGQEKNWFESPAITGGAIFAAGALLALVFHQLRSVEPIVNFRLLWNGPLAVGAGLGVVVGLTLYGTMFLLPQFTQNLLGYPPFESGMVLLPRAVTFLIVLPLAGWLYNKVGPRLYLVLGSLIQAWCFRELSQLSLESGFWNLVPILLLMGVGLPLVHVSLLTASFHTVRREDMTEASSLFTLADHVGGNVGYALISTLLARRSFFHRLRLASNLSLFNSAFLEAYLARKEHLQAVEPGRAEERALTLMDSFLHSQASMLAYNDVAWLLAMITLAVVPFCLMLKRRA